VRSFLVVSFPAQRFVAARVGSLLGGALRGGLAAFGDLETALLARGLAARMLRRSTFALACATLLIVALAAPPLVLVARGVLAALASGPPVRGVLIRGVLSSITYGALTAPP
jgi:hypothetical protein